MAEPDAEIVDELYAASLDEFIARRDARAKQLRKGGDRAAGGRLKSHGRASM